MTENSTSILGIAIRDIQRLQTVSTTVARHGFGELVARSPLGRLVFKDRDSPQASEELRGVSAAERFRRLLEALGPTYIKLGQVLSMRPDRLPPDYIEALQALQDQAPVLPFEQIKSSVEAGLGKSIDELFADFDEEPLGIASIAQTHLATTHDGRRVVVKVQRPGIEAIMRGDLDLLYLGARILEATIDEMALYSPSDVVMEFERALVRELNFTFELSNLTTAGQLMSMRPGIVVPEPLPELSSRTVLTMGFFKGSPLRTLKPGSARAASCVEELLRAMLQQVFVDGFFHGDPHSGNILVNEEGQVCLIDFGLVGRLNTVQREDLMTLIVAAIANDVDTLARILIKIGTPTRRVNMAEFKEEITRIRAEQFEIANLEEYDASGFIQAFVGAAQKYRIKLNTEYSVLVKAAATLENIIGELHPEVDVVGIARETLEPLIKSRLTPQKLVEEAMSGVSGVGSLIRLLPGQLDQVLHDLETGNVQVRALTPGLKPVAPMIHQVGSRLSMALFGASMSLSAAVLLPEDPTTVYGVPILSVLCILLAVFAWTVLWWWHFLGTGRPVKVSPLVRFFKRD